MKQSNLVAAMVAVVLGAQLSSAAERVERDFSPPATEQQLSRAMHSKMERRPHIKVGGPDAALEGSDNRVLQAAVDYIAALGGGTVEIGPGEFLMHDSLHLRSNVTVRGTDGRTVLRKAPGSVSLLAIDGDFGEQQITVVDASGFSVGSGVAVWDDNAGGFHTTVGRITGQTGNTFAIDMPLMSDCMVHSNARAGTLFPVISGYNLSGAKVEGLVIDGNRSENEHLNGCRGGGIFLYRAFGTQIVNCVVRDYNGDGISFQQSNDVSVIDCVAEGNSFLGIHPGSGSQRATVKGCVASNNGTDGLFLCWRVRHGLFEDNVLKGNGRFGISIGHKDSDNLLQRNHVLLNHSNGIFFRNESLGMGAHRNRLKDNVVENNGGKAGTAGIRIRGTSRDLVFEGNTIRDTRQVSGKTQTIGVLVEEQVGNVILEGNTIDATTAVEDKRSTERQ